MDSKLDNMTEKPYDLCIDCPNLGTKCDGPNFLAASMKRLCEWARKRKDHLHKSDTKWTNAFIAEKTGISIGTVNRFFAGNVTDIKMSSIAYIMKVLIKEEFEDEAWGRFPCPMVALAEDDPTLKAELERFKEDMLKLQEDNLFLKGQIAAKDSQIAALNERMQERTGFMQRKDRIMRMLSVMLGICLFIIFAALVMDKINPNIGFFWVH